MAKPTLLQTLLNQPSRSYLEPPTPSLQPYPASGSRRVRKPSASSRPSSVHFPAKSPDEPHNRRHSTALSSFARSSSPASSNPDLAARASKERHRHSSFDLGGRGFPVPTLQQPPPHNDDNDNDAAPRPTLFLSPPPRPPPKDMLATAADPTPTPRKRRSRTPSDVDARRAASTSSDSIIRPDTIYYDVETGNFEKVPTATASSSSSMPSASAQSAAPPQPPPPRKSAPSKLRRRHSMRFDDPSPPVPSVARIAEESNSSSEDEVFVTPPSSPPSSPRFFPSYDQLQSQHSQPSSSRQGLPPVKPPGLSIPSRPTSPSSEGGTSSVSSALFSSRSQTTAQTSAVSSSSSGKGDPTRALLSSSPLSAASSSSSSRSHRRTRSLASNDDWTDAVKWLGPEGSDQYVRPPVPTRAWTHIPKAQGDQKIDRTYSEPQEYGRRSLDSALEYASDDNNDKKGGGGANGWKMPRGNGELSRSNSGSKSSAREGGIVSQRRAAKRAVRMATMDSSEMEKRMSAVLEVDDDSGEIIGTADPSLLPRSKPAPSSFDYSYRHSRSLSLSGGYRPPSISSSSRTSASYKTVEIPSILDVFDGQTTYHNGFTSLTLPRAATAPTTKPDLISGNVDLTLSGQAQATMGTISVIKGAAAAAAASAPPTGKRLRRLSWGSRPPKEAETPAHLRSGLDASLAFTTISPTPSKFTSSQVIVKVFAVAISDLDRLLVKSKLSDGYGYVPGRAFVGRVMEAGWEVNDVRRGDWVMGLTEFGKAGALAEFVVVDRTRVAIAPKPAIGGEEGPTIEQVALLPLSAVPAHRAVKTYPHVALTYLRAREKKAASSSSPKKASSAKQREESRLAVMVLGSHTGVGTLVVEELLVQGDVDVLAHLPMDDLHVFDEMPGVDVVRGEDPEAVLKSCKAGSFIMVVDCIGGDAVRRAAKRVLDPRCGQFTTVVGDDPNTVPTRQAYTKSNLRSLRHTFGGKGSNAYEWVCPVVDVDSDGGDVRNMLNEIGDLVERGLILLPQPPEECIVRFERGMDVFKERVRGDSVIHIVG